MLQQRGLAPAQALQPQACKPRRVLCSASPALAIDRPSSTLTQTHWPALGAHPPELCIPAQRSARYKERIEQRLGKGDLYAAGNLRFEEEAHAATLELLEEEHVQLLK